MALTLRNFVPEDFREQVLDQQLSPHTKSKHQNVYQKQSNMFTPMSFPLLQTPAPAELLGFGVEELRTIKIFQVCPSV